MVKTMINKIISTILVFAVGISLLSKLNYNDSDTEVIRKIQKFGDL